MHTLKPLKRSSLPRQVAGITILHVTFAAGSNLGLSRITFKTGFRKLSHWQHALANISGEEIYCNLYRVTPGSPIAMKRASLETLGLGEKTYHASFENTQANFRELLDIVSKNDVEEYCKVIDADPETMHAASYLHVHNALSFLTGEKSGPTRH